MQKRRVENNPDALSNLFRLLRAQALLQPKLPAPALIILVWLSRQPGACARYKDAREKCGLTAGQMEHAVGGLIDAGLVMRALPDAEDARLARLAVSEEGRSVVEEFIEIYGAQSVD